MPASLLGEWTAAEGTGNITLAARTSTSGTLITAHGGSWADAVVTISFPNDNQSNAYTEPIAEIDCDPGADASYGGAAYNANGTRGASHTVTVNFSGTVNSAYAAEWSGVEASPTVVSTSATGSSTAPSASAAVGAASLVVGHIWYNGANTTIVGNGSTDAENVDVDNSNQEFLVTYKVTQTGTPSIAGTLGASRVWGVIFLAFTEAAAGGRTALNTRSNPLGVNVGMGWRMPH